MDRSKLPFRLNCEGYFFFSPDQMIARPTSFGIEFPGGGVELGENPHQALLRETAQETGVVVSNLKSLGTLRFIWSSDWAHTPKQKERYQRFQGEHMHFFTGIIQSMQTASHPDAWGNIRMNTSQVIAVLSEKLVKKSDPYTQRQLELVHMLLSNFRYYTNNGIT